MPSELIQAFWLGLLQGLTEFLPVSSSGHLVLLPALLAWEPPSLQFAVMVHMGTLLALILVYVQDLLHMVRSLWRTVRWQRLADYAARDSLYILVASVPAGVAGVVLQPYITAAMDQPRMAAMGLCGTGVLLGGSELWARWRERELYMEEMSLRQAVVMGLGQALALWPGVSRSGAAMAAGRSQGLPRDGVARFSFLLGVPVMLGAGVWELVAQEESRMLLQGQMGLPLLVGFVTSFLAGFAAIRLLLRFVRRHSLYLFALYCLSVGLGVLWILP